jgi:hypothetical protein
MTQTLIPARPPASTTEAPEPVDVSESDVDLLMHASGEPAEYPITPAAYNHLAEAGYGDYWILNLVDRVLEVYRRPMQSDGRWIYADKTTIAADGTVSPLAKPEVQIKVADLLPRP